LTIPPQPDHTVAADRRLTRLAYDIHDGPLQELVLLADDLRLAADQIDSVVPEADRARVRGRFQDLEARLQALEESLREIAQGGRSASSVAHSPLEEIVRAEVAALDVSGISAELEVDGGFDELTDSQKIALVRVVQEGLSNVRKHSGASAVSVSLRATPEGTELTIRDDGRGFDPRTLNRNRLGLAGVEERIRMLGGDVKIESTSEKGATLRARLPQWQPPTTHEN
jgi:signal transduction histidine kinase